MKNRYAVNNNIITGVDSSCISSTYYMSDEMLPILDKDGVPQYKVVGGKHELRTKVEIEADAKYISKSNQQILSELKNINDNSIELIRKFIVTLKDCPAALITLNNDYKTKKAQLK
jgi:hypothetical protein